MFKKIFIISIIVIIVLSNIVFADDEIDEEELFDFEETIQASNTTNEPNINSRAAIVYERSTGTVLYGKNENSKRKMASTTKIMTT